MNLRSANTLQLPCIAHNFFVCQQVSDLAKLPPVASRYILGGGSNVVLPEQLTGQVIHVALMGKRILKETEEAWYISAKAGESWHEFVLWTLAQGYAGLENLVLIPGTVGAAPVQNIGAYGVEVKNYIDQVIAYDFLQKDLVYLTACECEFAYRDSFFKRQPRGRFLITEVIFRLPKQIIVHLDYGEIKAELERQKLSVVPAHIAKAVIAVLQRKLPDPAKIGNAGSFFKNPMITHTQADLLLAQYAKLPYYPVTKTQVKLAAGWLIEQAGWKGKQLGAVGMYDKQALVLVNHGGATAQDVRILCEAVQTDVLQQFGVALEPEPSFW
jgi:UDP-N-acetylmuramate dehydrogenase